MSFKVSAENALLGILMTGPKHGYELHGYVSTKMNQFWDLSMRQCLLAMQVGSLTESWPFPDTMCDCGSKME